jgi:hypothetical protein
MFLYLQESAATKTKLAEESDAEDSGNETLSDSTAVLAQESYRRWEYICAGSESYRRSVWRCPDSGALQKVRVQLSW